MVCIYIIYIICTIYICIYILYIYICTIHFYVYMISYVYRFISVSTVFLYMCTGHTFDLQIGQVEFAGYPHRLFPLWLFQQNEVKLSEIPYLLSLLQVKFMICSGEIISPGWWWMVIISLFSYSSEHWLCTLYPRLCLSGNCIAGSPAMKVLCQHEVIWG